MQLFFVLFHISVAIVTCESAYVVDHGVGIGRRFDGIGGLSGGATSKLLVSYPESQRNEILDYLFKPNFGASLQILKVEIGGDAQSTDGTESSHMHESWDENYQRGYEWWLITEAKKRNPDIKLYGLPWTFPGWLGNGSGSPYKYPNETANYILKWLVGAHKYYNVVIDYIGIWNERNYDVTYVQTLKNLLKQNDITAGVQVVVADSDWGVSDDVLRNPTFAAAVDIIGCHYPGTLTSDASIKTNKPLWSSEDYSTFNDNVGAGCWARILNQNYVNGYMTSTISWNLIASYYEALPYGRDGLMTAQEPWSGHYVVESPIWVTAHTTQFTDIGWNYLAHGYGVQKLDFGGSFVTLISPDRKDITIIIETMSHDHSVCIRPDLPPYNVVAQQADFQLAGNLSLIEELHVWKTELHFGGKPSTLFDHQPSVMPFRGIFTMILYPDQLYTLTTLTVGKKGSYEEPPISKSFPLPYSDDFEGYAEFTEAFNFAPQSGVWEIRQTNDPHHGKVNRQVILNDPIYWCNSGPSTVNIGGSFNWSDIIVQVDVLIPTVNGSFGTFVGARVDRGGCDSNAANGVFFTVYANNGTFIVTSDLARRKVLVNGLCPVTYGTWHTIELVVKGGVAYGFLNSKYLYTAAIPSSISKGFAAYGTTNYGVADFDNFSVTSSNVRSQTPLDIFMPDAL
jgi:galactosylceramidase